MATKLHAARVKRARRANRRDKNGQPCASKYAQSNAGDSFGTERKTWWQRMITRRADAKARNIEREQKSQGIISRLFDPKKRAAPPPPPKREHRPQR